jgi:5-methylcytosine-specific restriction protein B
VSAATAEAEQAARSIAESKRVWVLPILRTLDAMGGSGRPKEVISKVLSLFSGSLSESQLNQIRDNARMGWTRLEMVKVGLLGGDRGFWSLTPVGRAYLEAHRNDSLQVPRYMTAPQAEDEEATEVVSVTETRAYEIPILAVLRKGRLLRKEILARVYNQMRERLLPGDTRSMPNSETMVALYRAGWAISNLWRDGLLKNPARGYWEITERGLERLESEEAFFNVAQYQGASKATVLVSSGTSSRGGSGTGPNLRTLQAILGSGVYQDLRDHLQLAQGPTPTHPQGLTRNLIFYGPPGTGKTRMARLAAQALAEEESPGTDSRWRVIQFHTSYTHQDFVQGLRPDLESSSLSYRMASGPFLEICAHAEAEPDRYYVLVIDEINRGEPARIFGEAIYALEYRGEEVQLSSESTLRVPPNLVVLGTMNSADRRLALEDHGLRRRFGFLRVDPDPEVITDLMVGNSELVAGTLEIFNNWLEKTLDRDHMLGHSYFLNPAYHPFTPSTIDRIWRLHVHPLMEEYFAGDPERTAEARTAWKRAITSAATRLAKAAPEAPAETAGAGTGGAAGAGAD